MNKKDKKDIKKDNNKEIKYYETEITCITCQNVFTSGSTKGKEMRVDVCSNCHPFYTGKQQFEQVTGRVERFRKQEEKQKAISSTVGDKRTKDKQKEKAKQSNEEILAQLEKSLTKK